MRGLEVGILQRLYSYRFCRAYRALELAYGAANAKVRVNTGEFDDFSIFALCFNHFYGFI